MRPPAAPTSLLNGVQQADGAPIAVTAAQSGAVAGLTASANQTNHLTVQAYDGYRLVGAGIGQCQPYLESPLTDPSVITVTGNLVAQTNSWLEATASTLPITVTDADGDLW